MVIVWAQGMDGLGACMHSLFFLRGSFLFGLGLSLSFFSFSLMFYSRVEAHCTCWHGLSLCVTHTFWAGGRLVCLQQLDGGGYQIALDIQFTSFSSESRTRLCVSNIWPGICPDEGNDVMYVCLLWEGNTRRADLPGVGES